MGTDRYKRVAEAKGWIEPDEALLAARAKGAPASAATAATMLPAVPQGVSLASPPASPGVQRWPAPRIAAVETLWGDGFVQPGGAPETLRLVKPLGLNKTVTLMILGGGLGGPAQTISGGFGAWVSSLEADPDLCALAAARLVKPASGTPKSEPANRITVASWERQNPVFKPRSANHALALEAMRGTPPGPLIDSLAETLRPQGHIVLTELVSDESPSEKDREFAAWCRLDNRLPDLPRTEDITAALQRKRFDVRVVEDMSDRHITQTLGGWREAVRAMAAGPRPAPQTAGAFVTEAELWLLRIRLMRRLGVRLMRWHAIGA